MLHFYQHSAIQQHKPLIQAKLKIGKPGDKYEQEADAVADRVMRMRDTDSIQMQPIEEEEEELQPKLRMQPEEEEEEMMQPKLKTSKNNKIQMVCKNCEDELLQTKSTNSESHASEAVTEKIRQTRGNGKPLPDNTNQFMSGALGADFSDVKIHANSTSSSLNQSLNSRAFTYGNNIYFNKGEYNPSSTSGKKLLAHELTHVVQQTGSTIHKQATQATVPQTERRNGLGIRGRTGLYDAVLNRGTNTLTLEMRVAFNFTGPWPNDAAKTRWSNDFERLVENRWSYRYYLVPDGVCSSADETFFARVNVIPVTSNPHFNITVAYVTSHAGSSANSVTRTASLDSMDTVERTRTRAGESFQQRGVEHEFGHMLGLAHIECDVTTGVCPAGDQYGDTPSEAGDIMGVGTIVSERDYLPFTTAMYYFTGCNWTASHQMHRPLGDFPIPSGDTAVA